jgi:hypothetical protein
MVNNLTTSPSLQPAPRSRQQPRNNFSPWLRKNHQKKAPTKNGDQDGLPNMRLKLHQHQKNRRLPETIAYELSSIPFYVFSGFSVFGVKHYQLGGVGQTSRPVEAADWWCRFFVAVCQVEWHIGVFNAPFAKFEAIFII